MPETTTLTPSNCGSWVSSAEENLPPAGFAEPHGLVRSWFQLLPPHRTQLSKLNGAVRDRDHVWPPTSSCVLIIGRTVCLSTHTEANPAGVSDCPPGSRSASKMP